MHVPGEKTPPARERRAAVRYSLARQVPCHLLATGRFESAWARIADLSAVGVGLQVGRPIEPGTVLSVELHGVAMVVPRTLTAQVVWTEERPGAVWAVGCRLLERLSDDELRRLLS
jgi:hypothetical protein